MLGSCTGQQARWDAAAAGAAPDRGGGLGAAMPGMGPAGCTWPGTKWAPGIRGTAGAAAARPGGRAPSCCGRRCGPACHSSSPQAPGVPGLAELGLAGLALLCAIFTSKCIMLRQGRPVWLPKAANIACDAAHCTAPTRPSSPPIQPGACSTTCTHLARQSEERAGQLPPPPAVQQVQLGQQMVRCCRAQAQITGRDPSCRLPAGARCPVPPQSPPVQGSRVS